MKSNIIKIGITGGIGSGKSYISELMRKKGIPVFDFDSEAKSLMIRDHKIISSLKALLGEDAYINGEINKPLMISYIFSSPENTEKINSIVHPRVKEEFISWSEEKNNEGYNIVAIESAILFESGFDSIVDKIVTVHAPLETRISRVIKRDNTTREKILDRIKSQIDESLKLEKSDFIIENDGEKSPEAQIDAIISLLSNKR